MVQRPPNRELEYHAVAELWFDDRERIKKVFSSPEGKLTQKDTEGFASRTKSSFTEEHEIIYRDAAYF
jgi:hypothetical protein